MDQPLQNLQQQWQGLRRLFKFPWLFVKIIENNTVAETNQTRESKHSLYMLYYPCKSYANSYQITYLHKYAYANHISRSCFIISSYIIISWYRRSVLMSWAKNLSGISRVEHSQSSRKRKPGNTWPFQRFKLSMSSAEQSAGWMPGWLAISSESIAILVGDLLCFLWFPHRTSPWPLVDSSNEGVPSNHPSH